MDKPYPLARQERFCTNRCINRCWGNGTAEKIRPGRRFGEGVALFFGGAGSLTPVFTKCWERVALGKVRLSTWRKLEQLRGHSEVAICA
jgi:hypothetical protein